MGNRNFQQQFSDNSVSNNFRSLWGDCSAEVKTDLHPLSYFKKINFNDEEKFYLVFLQKGCIKISAQTATEALKQVKGKDVKSIVYAPVALRKIYAEETIETLK